MPDMTDTFRSEREIAAYWRHLPVRRNAAFLLRQSRKNGGGVHLLRMNSLDYEGAALLVRRGRGAIQPCITAPGNDVFVPNRFA